MTQDVSLHELNSFLAELERNDPGSTGLSLAELSALEQKELKEDLPEEDYNAITSDNAWQWARRGISENDKALMSIKEFIPLIKTTKVYEANNEENAKRRASSRALKAEKIRAIKQNALNDNFIDLSSEFTQFHKQLLIRICTENYTERMIKTNKCIHTIGERFFKIFFPSDLLKCYYKYRNTMVPMPSFQYTASKEYGEGKTYQFKFDFPYYFRADDVEKIFMRALYLGRTRNASIDPVYYIDKNIVYFYHYKEARTEREIAMAKKLLKYNTFYDLLEMKPEWYELLINELKERTKKDELY